MESRPSHLQSKPKACYKTETRSKTQHQETPGSPSTRGGNGSLQLKKGPKSVDSLMQTKSPPGTLTPSTPTSSPPTSTTASPSTSRVVIVPAATASSIIYPIGITQGTTLTTGTSEHKIKTSGEGELKTSEKNSSRNIQKPTPQIGSTDLQKSFQKTPSTRTVLTKSVQQTAFSQIPLSNQKVRSSLAPTIDDRAESIRKGRTKEMAPSLVPKFKYNDSGPFVMEDCQEVHSVQPLGTKQSKVEKLQGNKDGGKNTGRDEEEGTSKDVQMKRNAITLQAASKCPIFPPTTSASQVKEAAGKADEHRNGKKGKIQEKTDKKVEKEMKRQDGNCETRKREQKDIEIEESKQEIKLNQNFKSFKDAMTMTKEDPVLVQTFDAALQTELQYKDAGVQAVVDVSDKFTTMSPNMTRPSWSHLDSTTNPNNHEKVSETAGLNLQNELSQDVSLDSGLAPVTLSSVRSSDKSPSPTPYKTSISFKPTRQHVCQIEIELCSQSTLSHSLALPEEQGPQVSSTSPGLEREPKQADKDQDQAEKGPLREVAWDDQGMTWEIYGAGVDMESLGFAIQNHLQRKIKDHEHCIRHLRKSVSLSEHSNSEGKEAGKKKKKRNVFRSLRPTCCLKSESEASVAY